LLNLAIIALKQLIKDNGFIHLSNVQTIRKEYNKNASTIDDFLNTKCRIDPTERANYTICRDIYHSYVMYCKKSNKTPVADNIFGGHLAAKGIKKEHRMLNRSREYCYLGISLIA
jgi:phage/plasmid-associated DNA primase